MRRLRFLPLSLVLLALALPAAADDEPEPPARSAWPQWRGPKRDGVSPEKNLLKQWPDDGPKLLWRAKGIGKGYSSVAVVGTRAYVTGDRGGKQYVLCLDGARQG